MQVNAETLHAKIERWEGLKRLYGELSLNEEYQLAAYKMLLGYLEIEAECKHVWIIERIKVGHSGLHRLQKRCNICGVRA